MAKRRNRKKRPSNTSNANNANMPRAAKVIGFSEAEEAFFAAGESEPHLEQVDTASSAPERPSLWRRLLARATLAA